MNSTHPSTDAHWEATTATGPYDFTSVTTSWDADEQVYVTRVSERIGAAWTPLEYHRSTTEEEARTTHRGAVRRHPKRGNASTLPRTSTDGRCTRCGQPDSEPHADRCRD
ncbi:hypothetical protein AB0H83_45855 [Dactylosporangium sp. NPDC050688]|uniref:hypothetical protein n=1 Tax=Dactylosporangium sp. NPDC050688 TaxID=3157217 RepID=UPI0033C4A5CF